MPDAEAGARSRSGGQWVVDALLAHGCDRVFCVPGESFLAILDALFDVRDRIQVVACRHEHGAAMMAEAAGKLTGRPGVCLVTRGPGACNAAIGVHTAFQDSTPMLLLVGQVQRAWLGREAFQEVDFEAMFRPLAKRVEQVDRAQTLPRALADAFHAAGADRPGPAVIAIPEDVLSRTVTGEPVTPIPHHVAAPDADAMRLLGHKLAGAVRPMMLLGGGGWTEQARADILAFAEANRLAVCCGFRRHDLFDNDHPCYAGDLGIGASPALVARVRSADLLVAVGSRLDEATTQGYGLFGDDGPRLVHVHPDRRELGRVFAPALAIEADAAAFAAAARAMPAIASPRWVGWTEAARCEFQADTKPTVAEDGLDPGLAMRTLRDLLPADAIVTVDAGNFSGWPQRFLRFGGGRRLLGATNGAMGYGVPAAVAAKLAHPERMVVACVGDGGFGMTGQELMTAVQYKAAPIVIVFDNGMYGTIRMHQERRYPGRTIATDLASPDFVALARAYGAYAERVTSSAAFAPAFRRAAAAGRAAVLVLPLDAERISTRSTLTELREPAG